MNDVFVISFFYRFNFCSKNFITQIYQIYEFNRAVMRTGFMYGEFM